MQRGGKESFEEFRGVGEFRESRELLCMPGRAGPFWRPCLAFQGHSQSARL